VKIFSYDQSTTSQSIFFVILLLDVFVFQCFNLYLYGLKLSRGFGAKRRYNVGTVVERMSLRLYSCKRNFSQVSSKSDHHVTLLNFNHTVTRPSPQERRRPPGPTTSTTIAPNRRKRRRRGLCISSPTTYSPSRNTMVTTITTTPPIAASTTTTPERRRQPGIETQCLGKSIFFFTLLMNTYR
jgi:hypothetical protein